ncbi:hypothetical protein D3C76_1155050 [compost metagenome]
MIDCLIEISVRKDNHWALATEFQHDWSKVFSSSLHNHLTYIGAASEKNEIERKAEQVTIFVSATLNNRDIFGGKRLSNDSFDYDRGFRGSFRWFDDASITADNGTNQRG